MLDNWFIGFELVCTDGEDVQFLECYGETGYVFDLIVEQGEIGEVDEVFEARDVFDIIEGEV